MFPTKRSTLWQYQLLQTDQEKQSDKKQTLNYFEYHYKSRCIALLCVSFLVAYFVVNSFEISSIWNNKLVSEVNIDVIYFNESTNYSTSNYDKFIIYTPQCTIPRIAVLNEETKKLFVRYQNKEYQCPSADSTVGFKRVNYTWVQIPDGLSCNAKEIERDAVSESFKYGKTFEFGNQTIMNFPNSDAVEINCKKFMFFMKSTKIIPLIPKKTSIWRTESQPKPNLQNRPNILAIGIDSISRLNYFRHFTETHKFITANQFEGPLYGLHKVGDNTWPNLMAMFTGMTNSTIYKSVTAIKKLDNVSLIFKSFSAAGYMTSYIEDMPEYGLFTYHEKNGFNKQPIEYMLRPVNILVHEQLKRSYCYKEKLEMELYHDYVYDQMKAFRERDQRFLTFIQTSDLTHDEFNNAQYADFPVQRFFKRIFDANLHNDTMILFYSDHGIRFGKILKTESGYHESRMPFMFFYIPENMRVKDSNGNWMGSEQIRKVLKINGRRLTSQFDVHATLRHILDEIPPKGEPYGRSFFTPSPLNRTCEDAGIPDEYCLCRTLVSYNDSQSLTLLTDHIIWYLNQKLKPFSSKCLPLRLDKILKSKISSDTSKSDSTKTSKQMFTIKILTQPNNGTIETTLQANVRNGQITDQTSIQITGSILRLDQYREQSKCAANTQVESFCYCRDLIINTN